jgi:SAM-dependent methyltransferase
MIEKARRNARDAGVAARFEVAGFGEMSRRFGGRFDAVTCVGNSLPHLLDHGSLRACLSDFAALLRPGGALVIQNRNYDRLLRERERFMPLVSRIDGEGETLFCRITEYPPQGAAATTAKVSRGGGGIPADAEESIELTLVILRKRDGAWNQVVQSTPLRALRRHTVESELVRAGFSSVRVYGSYDFAVFDAAGTHDLVAVAVK